MTRQHLLEIWDAAEGPDTMQAHLRVLLNAVRNYRAGRHPESDVFVWWGHPKVPSSGTMPGAFERISSVPVESDRNDPGPETHLYLTDLASLYVAHLGGITKEDVARRRDGRLPHIYKQHREGCETWYRLWDVRRLVENDTSGVARELRKLRNVANDNRPLRLHEGLPRAPFVVADSGEMRYFDPPTRTHFIEDKFWVEFDAERGGLGALERELRDNQFGDEGWSRFGPLGRSFIATGEKLWREHAGDPMFDVSVVVMEFSKAMEVRCNGVLREVLASAPSQLRMHNHDGRSVDVTREDYLGLADLSRFIQGSQTVFEYLRARAVNGAWFAGQLPPILKDLADIRNRAAHGLDVNWKEVATWRARLLGVGCHGYLVQLATVTAL